MADVNIPAELAQLPIENMIATPLVAVVKAQGIAANTTAEFIKTVGFNNIGDDKNPKYEVNSVSFKYGVRSGGDGRSGEISVPLLTVVPVPFIRVKETTVDFNFRINATAMDTSKQSTSASVGASGGFKFGLFGSMDFNVKGSYSSEKESKSTVDKTGELRIHVNAVQDEMPEGLRSMLSLLKELISIPTTQAAAGGSSSTNTATGGTT